MNNEFYLDKALKERLPALQVNYEDYFDPKVLKTNLLKIEIKRRGNEKSSLYTILKEFISTRRLKKSWNLALSKMGIALVNNVIYFSVHSPIWSELFWEEPMKGARWLMQELQGRYFPLLPIGSFYAAAYCLRLEDLITLKVTYSEEIEDSDES